MLVIIIMIFLYFHTFRNVLLYILTLSAYLFIISAKCSNLYPQGKDYFLFFYGDIICPRGKGSDFLCSSAHQVKSLPSPLSRTGVWSHPKASLANQVVGKWVGLPRQGPWVSGKKLNQPQDFPQPKSSIWLLSRDFTLS